MSQQAIAHADVFNQGWTPAAVTAQIGAATPNDARFVAADLATPGSTFEVQLTPLAWPSSGPRTLTVRLQQSGGPSSSSSSNSSGGAGPVTVLLLQGGLLIARRTVQPPPAFSSISWTLTDAEAAAISDYTSLRLLVSIGSPRTRGCTQTPGGAAFLLTFTPSGISNGSCPDCAGLNVPTTLVYQSGCTWSAPATYCGSVHVVGGWQLSYNPGAARWELLLGTGDGFWTAPSWDGQSALTLNWNSAGLSSLCRNYPAQITLTPL